MCANDFLVISVSGLEPQGVANFSLHAHLDDLMDYKITGSEGP